MDPSVYGLSRQSFQLDPEYDSVIFAGRNDVKKKIQGRIKRGLATNTSVHTFIYGDYGSGKTHTLHFFHKYVEAQHGVDILPVFVAQPQIDARSTPSNLYRSIITAISPSEIFDLFSHIYDSHQDEIQQHPELYRRIAMLQEHVGNRDLTYVIYKYIISRPAEDYTVMKWMSGVKCTQKEKQTLGVISDNSDPSIAIRTLLSIFRLFNRYQKKYILLLIDELETLRVLTTKKQVDFENFFRQLVSEQQGIATILAQAVEQSLEDGLPMFLGHSPVGSRIGYPQNYIWLRPFEDPDDAMNFIKDLLRQLRPPDLDLSPLIESAKKETDETITEEYFPFTYEALENLITYLLETGEIYPRNIQTGATSCLGEIISEGLKIITSKEVDEVMI